MLLRAQIYLLFLLMLLPAAASHAASFGIESFTSLGTASSNDARGYRFRAEADLEVTHLGMFDVNANGVGGVVGYDVHLWSDAGALLASASIQPGTASSLQNGFRWEAIASVFLTSGSIYRLSVDFGDDSGHPEVAFNQTALTTNVNFTIMQAAGALPAGLNDFGVQAANGTFPSGVSSGSVIGPNIMFDVAVVPEPGTALLLGFGLCAIAHRRRSAR